MRKILSMLLCLLLVASAATAETVLNGAENRGIVIEKPEDDHPWVEKGFSPTTGRVLSDVAKDAPTSGFAGVAITGRYMPMLVQIDNADGGIGYDEATHEVTGTRAPWGAQYADVIYETALYKAGDTRLSFLFSDLLPDEVGPVRSARLFHAWLREEWDCAFVTSGYSSADVPQEWKNFGVMNPQSATPDNPGLVYVQNYPKVWAKYMYHCTNIYDANDHVYQLANIVQNVIPKDHVPANHTFKFTDEVPAGGDSGEIVYITFGGGTKTDSRLEYDEENNEYIRYVPMNGQDDFAYRVQNLVIPKLSSKHVNGSRVVMVEPDDRVYGDLVTFTNVIVQGITMNWRGSERPDPELTGTGNADYFIGGKHYTGVWQRKDYNSRTVFYGEDGNEIELMRGKTLIVLLDYNNKGRSLQYE